MSEPSHKKSSNVVRTKRVVSPLCAVPKVEARTRHVCLRRLSFDMTALPSDLSAYVTAAFLLSFVRALSNPFVRCIQVRTHALTDTQV